MPTTTHRIQLHGTAPIKSCTGGKHTSLLILLWVWCCTQSQHLPLQSLYRKMCTKHVKWAHKKTKLFQAKEAQCHKLNYDKQSKTEALEVGGIVLVHITAFKGHHKIQNWWENREYVVERQPYPSVPVYVVCPGDGEGHSWTLHRNYLLSISANLKQTEKDVPMAGVERTSTSVPVPSVGSEPADTEQSGIAMSDTTGSTFQDSPDQPAPLRCGTHITQNQLPWRYQNFTLLADTSPPSILDAWVGLCICLHLMSCLYTIHIGRIV